MSISFIFWHIYRFKVIYSYFNINLLIPKQFQALLSMDWISLLPFIFIYSNLGLIVIHQLTKSKPLTKNFKIRKSSL